MLWTWLNLYVQEVYFGLDTYNKENVTAMVNHSLHSSRGHVYELSTDH